MKELKKLGSLLSKKDLKQIKGSVSSVDGPIEEEICNKKRKPRVIICD